MNILYELIPYLTLIFDEMMLSDHPSNVDIIASNYLQEFI